MINLYDLLCSLQCIIKPNESGRERVRQREIGRDRDIAGFELRHNGWGLASAQLNGQAYNVALNQECETVSRRSQWVLCLAEGKRLKYQKVQCAARREIWHMELPKQNEQTFFPPKTVDFFWKHQFPIREVYENMTPLWKSHPAIHRRLSLPPSCFWWAAIIFIPRSQIDVCNWSSNLWSGLGAG